MNRYKLTYRRSRVEEYVLALSRETLDEDDVENKVMEIWKEYGSEVVARKVSVPLLDAHGQDNSSPTITDSRFVRSSLLEVEFINVVEI